MTCFNTILETKMALTMVQSVTKLLFIDLSNFVKLVKKLFYVEKRTPHMTIKSDPVTLLTLSFPLENSKSIF